jgi:hypothetical protein
MSAFYQDRQFLNKRLISCTRGIDEGVDASGMISELPEFFH